MLKGILDFSIIENRIAIAEYPKVLLQSDLFYSYGYFVDLFHIDIDTACLMRDG